MKKKIFAYHIARSENLAGKPEPRARLDAAKTCPWEKTEHPGLLRCDAEKDTLHPARIEMRPLCVLLMLDAISAYRTEYYTEWS